jgi:hypothetical protein
MKHFVGFPMFFRPVRAIAFVTLVGAGPGASFSSPALFAAVPDSPSAALSDDGGWRSLLDEKLSGWEIWMGVPHTSVQGLPEGTPKSFNGRTGVPMGLGNDPNHVFTVRLAAGEPVLVITGEIWGGLTTRESFSNYHLRADIKWGERRWEPRLVLPRNSGILYHCTGPHGAFWNTWKRCLEFEVMEDAMGDLNPLGGTRAEVAITRVRKLWTYDPMGTVTAVGAGVKESGGNRAAHLLGNFEKPSGEWNTLELYTIGRTAVHVVNAKVVNVIHRTGVLEGSPPVESPLEGGQLQLQSEGAEVYFRRIQIRPITEFPAEIKQAIMAEPASYPHSLECAID